jgi:hypothetical protein
VFNYLIEKGLLSQENIQWLKDKGYLNENGKMDCSDRFTAGMSNTTEKGNTGGAVWWSMRNHGVVPEHKWTWDKGRDVPYNERFGDWFRDKTLIPEEVKELGKEFVARFEIFYERVPMTEEGIKKALENSPIQVFIPTGCSFDINGVQQYCDKEIGHAVSNCDDLNPRGYYPLFDHYIMNQNEKGQERFIRKVAKDYKFWPDGYTCTVIEKNIIINDENMDNTFVRIIKDADSPAVGFWFPAFSPDIIKNLCRIYGKQVPLKTDGVSIDWEKFIEGTVKLEKKVSE